MNPGLIRSDIRSNYLGAGSLKHRFVEWLVGLLMPSAETYAQRLVPVLFAPEIEKRSGAMFNAKGRAIHASQALNEAYIRAFTGKAEALAERALTAKPAA